MKKLLTIIIIGLLSIAYSCSWAADQISVKNYEKIIKYVKEHGTCITTDKKSDWGTEHHYVIQLNDWWNIDYFEYQKGKPFIYVSSRDPNDYFTISDKGCDGPHLGDYEEVVNGFFGGYRVDKEQVWWIRLNDQSNPDPFRKQNYNEALPRMISILKEAIREVERRLP